MSKALEDDAVSGPPDADASYAARESAALLAILALSKRDVAEGRTVDIRIAVERIKQNYRQR